MKVGQIIEKNGDKYAVYKIQEHKAYAENALGGIIRIPILNIVK